MVISPLFYQMKDPKDNLKKIGNTTVSLCDLKDGAAKAVGKGQLSVVCETLEA